MMDTGARNFRAEQEKAKYIQKMQEQIQQRQQRKEQITKIKKTRINIYINT